MPRKSTIEMDERIQETVDRLIRENRATIDQIVATLEKMVGEEAPSRSAVGRYVKRANERMEQYRQAREVAKVWAEKLGEEPKGDMARLLTQMMQTIAYQAFENIDEVDPQGLMLLSTALKNLAASEKITLEARIKIRREMAQEAVKEAEKIGRQGGLSAETIDTIKRSILGVAG